MRFNPKATIDTGRTKDVGRSGGGGGGLSGLPIPGGAGGGIAGFVILLIIFVIGQVSGAGPQIGGGGGGGPETETNRYNQCQTGADANKSADCARALVENSLTGYWAANLEKQTGTPFTPVKEVKTFTAAISTGGCGNASSDVGPFYCPLDQTIYLDTSFFKAILEDQLGGRGGDFVEPYVLAHEYGHHIQNLLGTMNKVKTQQGPKSDAVRLELQADCYAGMWTKGAMSTTDAKGVKIFDEIDRADIDEAIDSATTVGDDRIQETTGGKVNPESWTHGSSAQRVKWFQTGFSATSIKSCDTFASNNL